MYLNLKWVSLGLFALSCITRGQKSSLDKDGKLTVTGKDALLILLKSALLAVFFFGIFSAISVTDSRKF